MIKRNYILPLSVFTFTYILLAFVQVKVARPMILAERFIKGAGWIEIFFIASYGAFVVFKLKPENARKLYLIITISLYAACLALARI